MSESTDAPHSNSSISPDAGFTLVQPRRSNSAHPSWQGGKRRDAVSVAQGKGGGGNGLSSSSWLSSYHTPSDLLYIEEHHRASNLASTPGSDPSSHTPLLFCNLCHCAFKGKSSVLTAHLTGKRHMDKQKAVPRCRILLVLRNCSGGAAASASNGQSAVPTDRVQLGLLPVLNLPCLFKAALLALRLKQSQQASAAGQSAVHGYMRQPLPADMILHCPSDVLNPATLKLKWVDAAGVQRPLTNSAHLSAALLATQDLNLLQIHVTDWNAKIKTARAAAERRQASPAPAMAAASQSNQTHSPAPRAPASKSPLLPSKGPMLRAPTRSGPPPSAASKVHLTIQLPEEAENPQSEEEEEPSHSSLKKQPEIPTHRPAASSIESSCPPQRASSSEETVDGTKWQPRPPTPYRLPPSPSCWMQARKATPRDATLKAAEVSTEQSRSALTETHESDVAATPVRYSTEQLVSWRMSGAQAADTETLALLERFRIRAGMSSGTPNSAAAPTTPQLTAVDTPTPAPEASPPLSAAIATPTSTAQPDPQLASRDPPPPTGACTSTPTQGVEIFVLPSYSATSAPRDYLLEADGSPAPPTLTQRSSSPALLPMPQTHRSLSSASASGPGPGSARPHVSPSPAPQHPRSTSAAPAVTARPPLLLFTPIEPASVFSCPLEVVQPVALALTLQQPPPSSTTSATADVHVFEPFRYFFPPLLCS